MTLMFVLAPSTRFGYFIYPGALAIWMLAARAGRQADDALFDGLTQGTFCYVLTARQMGKSSLMVRTASRLRQEKVCGSKTTVSGRCG